jgi:methylated-DNA-[protein]-cysteine S-methyltransferase
MNTFLHPSPVGPLALASDDGYLVSCEFSDQGLGSEPPALSVTDFGGRDAVLAQACSELDRFFAGQLHEFTVPLRPRGTEFQRQVWAALRRIPYGETTSYGEIARAIGRPAAVRAVGAANGRNPICILIPCHRVIGADGSLTGFGGGLDRKSFLLRLEQSASPSPLLARARPRELGTIPA